ncbi:MAG: glutamine-hydrolyzing carbamoyl-phosphate synthase small subunit [Kiritimatiellae bacterium]|nr:glutamine-hydrolyzing carbamoyl-phosphate synthase small subunit [Kiritimatiellia bacterium]
MTKKWNWLERREKRDFLALEDGTVLRGHSVGAERDSVGEVVFNTGMSGYQEILSDPSYSGQFVTMTYPEIGNTGINTPDMESRKFFANGFLVHELNEPSNWRCEESLSEAFKRQDVPALAGLDTRTLTSLLREKGTLKGYLSLTGAVSEEDAIAKARAWEGLDGQDYAAQVTCDEAFDWDPDGSLTASWGITDVLPETDLNIVAYDFGIKWNILRSMRRSGMSVQVVPASTPASDVLAAKPDGVFLSNGPADPSAVTYAIEAARELLGKVPLMGICLGHQILGLACGGKTYRLKFGHHGCNHPVMDLRTKKVEITSQNHNFAIDPESLQKDLVEVTHLNLNDQTVEGLAHRREPMFSVQYHPEACPGPHDPYYLFERFREVIASA